MRDRYVQKLQSRPGGCARTFCAALRDGLLQAIAACRILCVVSMLVKTFLLDTIVNGHQYVK